MLLLLLLLLLLLRMTATAMLNIFGLSFILAAWLSDWL
jgi:hypothetical protein